jgi:2'-5' RNA ligase
MKAAIAVLTNREVQNFVRRISFDFHKKYDIPFLASLLPAHISLKQPFSFASMDLLELYFDTLAQNIEPFVVELDHFYYTQWSGYEILGIKVKETKALRGLHNRINAELDNLFENTLGPQDGDRYRFFLTIELGSVDEGDVYKRYFKELEQKRVDLKFTAQEIALFYYYGDPGTASYLTYKILEIEKKHHSNR